jgi:hypothetical protein
LTPFEESPFGGPICPLWLNLLDSLPQHPPIVFDPVAPLGQFSQLNHLGLIGVPGAMTGKRAVGRNLQGTQGGIIMPNVEKMGIALTPELSAAVRAAEDKCLLLTAPLRRLTPTLVGAPLPHTLLPIR